MRKYQLVGLALIATFVFFAVAVSSALAEEILTYLLADWLLNGLKFTGELEAEQEGELKFQNTSNGAKLLCTIDFHEILRESADIEVLLILDLKDIDISELNGAALHCASEGTCENNASDTELWPLDLPWLSQIDLMEPSGMFVELFSTTPNRPLYHISCLVIGLKVEEECASPAEGAEGSEEALNVSGGVEFMGEMTPAGNCGTGTGNALLIWVAGNVLKPVEGGVLSESSE